MPPPKNKSSYLGVTLLIFLSCGILYFLLEWKRLPVPSSYIPVAQKILLALLLTSLVLFPAKLLKTFINLKIEDKTTVFNFDRVVDLFAGMLILGILLSLLFANRYAAMLSFGIVSLILGFALQNPITSFFGWLYILIRKPYEVGDRIRIGNVYGDIINVSYIDTTLWEFSGEYVSRDHPSGRIIRFTNSKVFSEYIYKFGSKLF